MSLDGFIAPVFVVTHESVTPGSGPAGPRFTSPTRASCRRSTGSEIRLFEGVDAGRVALAPVRAEQTQRVTHLTYAVRER